MIQTFTPAEAIRKRPALYVGSLDHGGLMRLIEGALCVGLDGFEDGTSSRIEVRVGQDGIVEIDEDGPGVSPLKHPLHPFSILEAHFTVLGACRDARGAESVRRLCDGTGLVCVNALTSKCDVESHWHGSVWKMSCREGTIVTPLHCAGDSHRTGLVLRFAPDPKIFSDTWIDTSVLSLLLEEVRRSHPCGEITLSEEG